MERRLMSMTAMTEDHPVLLLKQILQKQMLVRSFSVASSRGPCGSGSNGTPDHLHAKAELYGRLYRHVLFVLSAPLQYSRNIFPHVSCEP